MNKPPTDLTTCGAVIAFEMDTMFSMKPSMWCGKPTHMIATLPDGKEYGVCRDCINRINNETQILPLGTKFRSRERLDSAQRPGGGKKLRPLGAVLFWLALPARILIGVVFVSLDVAVIGRKSKIDWKRLACEGLDEGLRR